MGIYTPGLWQSSVPEVLSETLEPLALTALDSGPAALDPDSDVDSFHIAL